MGQFCFIRSAASGFAVGRNGSTAAEKGSSPKIDQRNHAGFDAWVTSLNRLSQPKRKISLY